jgi:hypothetical protein
MAQIKLLQIDELANVRNSLMELAILVVAEVKVLQTSESSDLEGQLKAWVKVQI